MFGGSDGGPQGPRLPLHGPSPWVRWVERSKGAFGSLKREYYWSLPCWKAVKENGLVLGVNIVVWAL